MSFCVFNHDDDPAQAIVNGLRKDFAVIESDLFGVVIDTFHDERNGKSHPHAAVLTGAP
ncbi:MAG: hypothetical protein IT176_08925 [Acidobacteria bacterium]|nr:hypothetical protein [Acidobacteriota bacterium]